MTLAELPPILVRIFALVFGLIWGSFLNVVIYRLPREMSLSRPASHCPACSSPIPAYRNVPVLSWLTQRGKAACCGARISARYPLVELAGGVLSLAIVDVLVLQLPGSTSPAHAFAVYGSYFALALGLVAAAFIDLEHMIVPDRISLGGTVLGVATFSLRNMDLTDALIGSVVGFVIVWLPFDVLYSRLRGLPGMGLGDAKLMMLAGAWLGWQGAVLVLCAGAIQGTLATLVVLAVRGRIEEPEAVIRERRELKEQLEQITPEYLDSLPAAERRELELELDELAKDPLAEDPEEGFGKARIAFGPFLILATLECLLIGSDRIYAWISAA